MTVQKKQKTTELAKTAKSTAKHTKTANDPTKTSQRDSSKTSQKNFWATPKDRTGKKKRLIIKKKVQTKKDISEHFRSNLNVPQKKTDNIGFSDQREARRPSSIVSGPKPSSFSSRGTGLMTGDVNRANLLMQTSPPTAAQARGRTMRAAHRGERFRYERDKDKEQRLQEERSLTEKSKHKKQVIPTSVVPRKIEIMESIQVGELAKKLNLRPNEVIGRLMSMGEMVTINKVLDSETAALLAAEYNCEVKIVSLYNETLIKEEDDEQKDHKARPPVVTIMGHVDHGKTKLLDTIRESNVIDSEAGAITQHIGAYQVIIAQGKITFLDTPGHEAFSAMRARGAAITDIVILVVAADDGVKQQTIEAIAHAREAKVPIIVAINKIDLADADVERVKKEFSQHGLSPEDWGGDTVFCEISAKENKGIEHLLEMILLQADMLNLTANLKLRAMGHVVEAKIDPGKGPVATILVEKGTLREGNAYVAGIYSGRLRAMFNDHAQRIREAPPSTPVEILGMDGVPDAGDPFQVVENDKYGREIAGKRRHYKQITNYSERKQPSLDDLGNWVQSHKELNVIIKADVQGSVEAIRDGLVRLSTDDVRVRVIYGATGAISESDVNLASASNALLIGFQVRAMPRVMELADQARLEIKYYSIIYDVTHDIKKAMEGMLEPDRVEEIVAKIDVRQIFKISRLGNVAGCRVLSGLVQRKHPIRVIRDNIVIHTGKIHSLRRVKEDVNEVGEGFECGIVLESFNELREGDQLESFQIKEIARKL